MLLHVLHIFAKHRERSQLVIVNYKQPRANPAGTGFDPAQWDQKKRLSGYYGAQPCFTLMTWQKVLTYLQYLSANCNIFVPEEIKGLIFVPELNQKGLIVCQLQYFWEENTLEP